MSVGHRRFVVGRVTTGYTSRLVTGTRSHNRSCLCITHLNAAMTQFTVGAETVCYDFEPCIFYKSPTHTFYGSASGRLRGVETDSSLNAVLEEHSAACRITRRCCHRRLVQDDTPVTCAFAASRQSQNPCCAFPAIMMSPRPCARTLRRAFFKFAGHTKPMPGNSSMLDSYDPGHVGGGLSPPELARLDDARAARRSTPWYVSPSPDRPMNSRWLIPWVSPSRRRFGG